MRRAAVTVIAAGESLRAPARAALGFLADPLWWLAAAAGFGVALGLRYWVPSAMAASTVHGAAIWFSCVVWQPVLEEVIFRGMIQGELLRRRWGQTRWLGLSAANLASSLLFTSIHFLHHPPLWAASVFVPSLLFGAVRERHRSVTAPIGLHVLFNLQFFLAAALAAG